MMARILKKSPVSFDLIPALVDEKYGWQVTREYKGEGKQAQFIDLSHISCWDLQDKDLLRFNDAGLAIPETNNGVTRKDNVLTTRLNSTQCQIWSLGGSVPDVVSSEACCTDITGGQAIFALMGPDISDVMDALTSLNVFQPDAQTMQLFQAPLFHVPCQMVVLKNTDKMKVVLIACARGYGSAMAKAILKSGTPFQLVPGGEKSFTNWLDIKNN